MKMVIPGGGPGAPITTDPSGNPAGNMVVANQPAQMNTISLSATGARADAGLLYENTDVTPYNYVMIQVTDAAATGITLEESTDLGVTYNTVIGIDKSDGTYKAITTATGVWKLPLTGNAFKATAVGAASSAITLLFGVE